MLKDHVTLFVSFMLLFVCCGTQQARAVDFEKSISIDHYFSVSKLADEQHRNTLIDNRQKITDLVSNVLRSFQQDFDYRFYNNYQIAEKQEGTFICTGQLLDRNQMNNRSKLYTFEGGDFFLRIEIIDPKSNITVFGKSFIIDSYIKYRDTHGLTQSMQEGLKEPLAMYFFYTSRLILPHNSRLDSITIGINQAFTSKNQVASTYLNQLTDLTSNAIVMLQKNKNNRHIDGEKYAFQFYRNYKKDQSAHQAVKSEVTGALQFDSSTSLYTLELDFSIAGQQLIIPKTLNPPIVFHQDEKGNYVDVALHIKQKVGLMLYYYFERHLSNRQ